MKRKNEHSLAEVLQLLKKKYGWSEKMMEVAAKDAWYRILGPVAQNHTLNITYERQTLTIHLNSSVLREELWMHKEKLLKAINEEIGQDETVVKNILLL
ncbi:MAG: DciA family protein [Thermaurantimonas sp.]|uniref:DciA family protein n=1 Tax=Thermaurantimonas sp. TaxID=2681568 RepID=UPI003918CCEF